jgi:hypothetical protein
MGAGFDLLRLASRGEGAQVLFNLLELRQQEISANTGTTVTAPPAGTQPGGQTDTVTTVAPDSTTVNARQLDAPEPRPGLSWSSPLVISLGAIALTALAVILLLFLRPIAARRRLLTAGGPSDDTGVQAAPGGRVEEVLHEWAEARAGSPAVPVTEEDVEDAHAWDHLISSRLGAEPGGDSSAGDEPVTPSARTGRFRLHRPKRINP